MDVRLSGCGWGDGACGRKRGNMVTLIKGGYVVNPATGLCGVNDVLVVDETVAEIAPCIEKEAHRVMDASGKYVMPGFVDLHEHLREPGFEYKETIATGSMAAAAGGFTTICAMPNTKPVIDSKVMVEYLNYKAAEDAQINIVPVGAVTVAQSGQVLADIEGMAAAGALALSEDGKSVMDPLVYKEGLKKAAQLGLVMLAHCEDRGLLAGGVMNAGVKAQELGFAGITNSVEDVIVARDILLAKETGVKLHLCHCSTADSVALVRMGKALGVKLSAEVCPHHFAMTEDEIPGDDANYKMNPPLRTRADADALIAGLADGTMEVIATDHAPHSAEEKKRPFPDAPFGIVGSETAFALSYTALVKAGHLTLPQLVEKLSVNPARILGIDKGDISVGHIADLVIADVEEPYVIDVNKFISKGKNSPFGGRKVYGKVLLTMVNGEVVYER